MNLVSKGTCLDLRTHLDLFEFKDTFGPNVMLGLKNMLGPTEQYDNDDSKGGPFKKTKNSLT